MSPPARRPVRDHDPARTPGAHRAVTAPGRFAPPPKITERWLTVTELPVWSPPFVSPVSGARLRSDAADPGAALGSVCDPVVEGAVLVLDDQYSDVFRHRGSPLSDAREGAGTNQAAPPAPALCASERRGLRAGPPPSGVKPP
ncbi:hypothetical protein [Streptomyces sp. NPDC059134]|uniref:hypothetical protein n=1 Tax=Streptomyces sp. NPDC059134 TaxID=3346738 RepID=UPI0036B17BA8